MINIAMTGQSFHVLFDRLDVESQTEGNDMNNNHLSALRNKHAELDQKLEREENRPFPDSNMIHSLKKQKLQLKDVLTQESSLTG
jgi:hypothetical protein